MGDKGWVIRVNHPVTKILSALPPAGLASGFLARMTISDGPPVTIESHLQWLSWPWAVTLIILCVIATSLAFISDREWAIKLRASTYFAIASWAAAIALGIFFREHDGQGALWSHAWWVHRDFTSSAAGFCVAAFFLYFWWDQIHFRLPRIRALETLGAKLDEIDREVS